MSNHPKVQHVPLGMVWRFKTTADKKRHFKRTVGKKMCIQRLASWSILGLEYRLWLYRMLVEYSGVGIVMSPVFQRTKTTTSGGNLNLVLHPLLLQVQEKQPELNGEDTKVEEEYNVSRLFKQGATAQAQNMNMIPRDVIEANNG